MMISAFDHVHPLGEHATHPLARPSKLLAVSLLFAGPGLLRTRKGQAGAVEPLKRQQPRSRPFVPGTRPYVPSGASNCRF